MQGIGSSVLAHSLILVEVARLTGGLSLEKGGLRLCEGGVHAGAVVLNCVRLDSCVWWGGE